MGTILTTAVIVAARCAGPIQNLDVTGTATVAATLAASSKIIVESYGIGSQHRKIEKCVLPEEVRTLLLKRNVTIVEEEFARDENRMADTYALVESPLPVDGCRSTLSVAPGRKILKHTWTRKYEAKVAPDAETVFGGIRDGDLRVISAKAG